ncbi:hypothetical protein ARD30_24210 [Bosea thiooxidans]|uniref:Uncharacterized protein n=1 Tax=Bosea thiooxidans TaxID=53254 RepID=A0A0Q3HZI6_9HYPH|nr:hypothetical protein ARD30_24210 [Bosea thiooxidans]
MHCLEQNLSGALGFDLRQLGLARSLAGEFVLALLLGEAFAFDRRKSLLLGALGSLFRLSLGSRARDSFALGTAPDHDRIIGLGARLEALQQRLLGVGRTDLAISKTLRVEAQA